MAETRHNALAEVLAKSTRAKKKLKGAMRIIGMGGGGGKKANPFGLSSGAKGKVASPFGMPGGGEAAKNPKAEASTAQNVLQDAAQTQEDDDNGGSLDLLGVEDAETTRERVGIPSTNNTEERDETKERIGVPSATNTSKRVAEDDTVVPLQISTSNDSVRRHENPADDTAEIEPSGAAKTESAISNADAGCSVKVQVHDATLDDSFADFADFALEDGAGLGDQSAAPPDLELIPKSTGSVSPSLLEEEGGARPPANKESAARRRTADLRRELGFKNEPIVAAESSAVECGAGVGDVGAGAVPMDGGNDGDSTMASAAPTMTVLSAAANIDSRTRRPATDTHEDTASESTHEKTAPVSSQAKHSSTVAGPTYSVSAPIVNVTAMAAPSRHGADGGDSLPVEPTSESLDVVASTLTPSPEHSLVIDNEEVPASDPASRAAVAAPPMCLPSPGKTPEQQPRRRALVSSGPFPEPQDRSGSPLSRPRSPLLGDAEGRSPIAGGPATALLLAVAEHGDKELLTTKPTRGNAVDLGKPITSPPSGGGGNFHKVSDPTARYIHYPFIRCISCTIRYTNYLLSSVV